MFPTLSASAFVGAFLFAMAANGSGWDAVILAAINLINLIVSAYNARRINTVRAEQKSVAESLQSAAGKEVKK